MSTNVPLYELGLSTRSYNVLQRAGIYDLDSLLKLTYPKLSGIRNCGFKVRNEILDMLRLRGLTLKD